MFSYLFVICILKDGDEVIAVLRVGGWLLVGAQSAMDRQLRMHTRPSISGRAIL
jgi:hypothetical protein